MPSYKRAATQGRPYKCNPSPVLASRSKGRQRFEWVLTTPWGGYHKRGDVGIVPYESYLFASSVYIPKRQKE